MTIEERISDDMKTAMKAKEEVRLRTLRSLRAAMKNESIMKGEERGALSDPMAIAVLTREAKKRKEAAEQFRKGDREELAVNEEVELKIIQEYLPDQLSEEDIRKRVEDIANAAEEKEFGAVMKASMDAMRGQADGSKVAQIVKEVLS